MKPEKYFLSIAALLFYYLGFAQNEFAFQSPKPRTDGWSTSEFSNFSQDTSNLNYFFKQLATSPHQIDGLLVAIEDQLVLEAYYGDWHVDRPHDLRSVSKSVRSLLIGIAIDLGLIQSIDDPISKYLTEKTPKKNLDPRKNLITIRHLLTMSAGWDCNDWDKKSKGQEDRMYKKKDWVQYTLDLPMIAEPGSQSTYCSAATLLLAEIIEQSSGMTIQDFAASHLFTPLQIDSHSWGHTSNKNITSSAKRLYLAPRDMAKIGQLVLDKGLWKDQQVVSSMWVEEMTAPSVKITGVDYGYLWWQIPYKVGDHIHQGITATGNGGQYIMIFPSLQLVAVFTGGAYNQPEDKVPFGIMQQVILPALISK